MQRKFLTLPLIMGPLLSVKALGNAQAGGSLKAGLTSQLLFHGDQVIVNAEVKAGLSPSAALLCEATSAALTDQQRR